MLSELCNEGLCTYLRGYQILFGNVMTQDMTALLMVSL